MLILEGTFSDDIITTGTSFQEDPCSGKQCQNKKERKTKRRIKLKKREKKKKVKANLDPEISNFSFFFYHSFY